MNEKEKEILECTKKIKEYCNGNHRCNKCVFFTKKYRDACLLECRSPQGWCLDDIQKKQLTDKQRQLLLSLDKKWKYIARDDNGVCLYASKPVKYKDLYCVNYEDNKGDRSIETIGGLFSEDMFDYLSYKDKEATLIACVLIEGKYDND